jgi:hypothetical protein
VPFPRLPGEPHEPLADELPGERVVAAGARLVEGPRGVGHRGLHELRVGDHQPRAGAEPVHERPAVPRRPDAVLRRGAGDDAVVAEGGEGLGSGGGQQGAVVGRVAGEQAPRWPPDALPPEAALQAERDPEEGVEQAEHVLGGREERGEEEDGGEGGHCLPVLLCYSGTGNWLRFTGEASR